MHPRGNCLQKTNPPTHSQPTPEHAPEPLIRSRLFFPHGKYLNTHTHTHTSRLERDKNRTSKSPKPSARPRRTIGRKKWGIFFLLLLSFLTLLRAILTRYGFACPLVQRHCSSFGGNFLPSHCCCSSKHPREHTIRARLHSVCLFPAVRSSRVMDGSSVAVFASLKLVGSFRLKAHETPHTAPYRTLIVPLFLPSRSLSRSPPSTEECSVPLVKLSLLEQKQTFPQSWLVWRSNWWARGEAHPPGVCFRTVACLKEVKINWKNIHVPSCCRCRVPGDVIP